VDFGPPPQSNRGPRAGATGRCAYVDVLRCRSFPPAWSAGMRRTVQSSRSPHATTAASKTGRAACIASSSPWPTSLMSMFTDNRGTSSRNRLRAPPLSAHAPRQIGMASQLPQDCLQIEHLLEDLLAIPALGGETPDARRPDHRTASHALSRSIVGTIRFQGATSLPCAERSRSRNRGRRPVGWGSPQALDQQVAHGRPLPPNVGRGEQLAGSRRRRPGGGARRRRASPRSPGRRKPSASGVQSRPWISPLATAPGQRG
jgi:hypothetical protein